jgi:hypothetical protein
MTGVRKMLFLPLPLRVGDIFFHASLNSNLGSLCRLLSPLLVAVFLIFSPFGLRPAHALGGTSDASVLGGHGHGWA